MKNLRTLAMVGLSVMLAGCYSFHYTQVDSLFGSSKASGGTQALAVNSNPAGASCNVTSYQDASTKTTQYVLSTPGSVPVFQAQEPIIVACSKTGYQDTQVAVEPTKGGTYPDTVTVNLAPVAASTGN